MQRRNREINIFSLSALDLFCGAMGAFMVLALIALPYYKKEQPMQAQINELKARVAELTDANQRMQQALDEAREAQKRTQQALEEAQRQARALQEKLSHTFLAVVVAWETKADIDLHVRTPSGNHYYFKSHNRPGGTPRVYPNEDAELSMDMQDGGAEVWQMLNAGPGKYQIGLHNFEKGAQPTVIKGLVLYRDGTHRFSVTLPHLPNDKPVLDVTVDEQGNVSVQNR